MTLEANVYRITNSEALSAKYKLYKIKGLRNAPDEYFSNRQHIIRRLSYSLKAPVTIIDRDATPYLVVRSDATPPPNLSLVGTVANFEPCQGEFELDFTKRSPENDQICIRFLDFWIQGLLFEQSDLWQPTAGQAFFRKTAETLGSGLIRYLGFSVRAVVTPGKQLGLCVDVTNKTVGKDPLSAHMSHDEFARWKNQSFIYHYGHNWYEIKAVDLSDQNVTEHQIPDSNLSLLEYVTRECKKPIPVELANVPHDASVVIYLDNRDENRSAIAPLCYPVYRTSADQAKKQHGQTILEPTRRRELIHAFVEEKLRSLKMASTAVQLSSKPFWVEPRIFQAPDIRFGQGKVLSVRSTPNTQHTSLDALGKTRVELLKDKSAGFYTRSAFDRQYLILPQSVSDSFGAQLISDLKNAVRELYPHEYAPVVVTYNDRVARTYAKQGNAIRKAIEENCIYPGYAVVMIHPISDRKEGAEDQLAAMVVRELYDRTPQILAAVIHSRVGSECYIQPNGSSSYMSRPDKRGLLIGYLRMVVINKILLTNQRWPFVLATRLTADLTIGLDVKHHTAGLVVVGSNGSDIQTFIKKSRQKEKLSAVQTKAYIVEAIRKVAKNRPDAVRTILLQRDGRTYDVEVEGAHAAIAQLKTEQVIPPDATLTIIEISKSAPVRFRLFDVSQRNVDAVVENPQIGTYCVINETEGYVCTTGRAFRRKGTVRPLHIRRVDGPLGIEACLEDIFYLSCLTWMRPEDCSRYPITLKLNDRFLSEEATDYDQNALELEAILTEEGEDTIDELEHEYD